LQAFGKRLCDVCVVEVAVEVDVKDALGAVAQVRLGLELVAVDVAVGKNGQRTRERPGALFYRKDQRRLAARALGKGEHRIRSGVMTRPYDQKA